MRTLTRDDFYFSRNFFVKVFVSWFPNLLMIIRDIWRSVRISLAICAKLDENESGQMVTEKLSFIPIVPQSTVNWSLIGSDMPSALGLVLRMTQYPQYSMPVCICKDVISSQSWRYFYKTIVISSELTLAYHRFPFPIPHGGWAHEGQQTIDMLALIIFVFVKM